MKMLSAKNKKNLIYGGALFALAVIGAIVYRAYKAVGSFDAKLIWDGIVDQIKDLFTINTVVILLTVGAGAYSAVELMSGTPGVATYALLLGALTTGAAITTTFNTQYLPKYFSYTAATQLTGVKITIPGRGVIFDLDANGLTHIGVNRLQGQLTNTYTFILSNSFLSGLTVTWDFTNSAAQTPSIYVDNDQTVAPGQRLIMQSYRQTILANSGQNFENFATLSLPSMAAADTLNVFYNDSTQQPKTRQDLLAQLQYTQNVINTPIYMLDNHQERVVQAQIAPTAQMTAYLQRWIDANSKFQIPLN
jgi:hypothetical protein